MSNKRQAANLVGEQFGRLTVKERVGNDRFGNPTWLCECVDGNTLIVSTGTLRTGNTLSCGCKRRDGFESHRARKQEHLNEINAKDDKVKRIALTKGMIALVDAEDYERVMHHSWAYTDKGYATAWIRGKMVLMHRFIMNAQPGEQVDHRKISEKVNNTKANLRFCTGQQNKCNRKKSSLSTQPYKGIRHDPKLKSRPWVAIIRIGGKKKCLGCFPTAELAALAYNEAAKIQFGEFAYLNEVSQ